MACVSVWVCKHWISACDSQKTLARLELELEVVVKHLVWMLETQSYWMPGRAQPWANPSAPHTITVPSYVKESA